MIRETSNDILSEIREFIAEAPLFARWKSGLGWNFLSCTITPLASFCVNILIAKILKQEGFGEFNIIQSTLRTFTMLAISGLGMAATKYVAEFRSMNPARAGRVLAFCSMMSLGMAVIAAGVLFGMSRWLAGQLFHAAMLDTALLVGSGFVLFSVLNGYQAGAVAGFEKYRAQFFIELPWGVFWVASTAWLASRFGLEGAVIALVLSALLRWILYARILIAACRLSKIRREYRTWWQERALVLRFILPAMLSGVSSIPVLWLTNTILVRQPDGFAQLGLFAAANSFRTMALFLPSVLNSVGLALLSHQRGLGDSARYRRIFLINLTLVVAVSIGSIVFVLVFGEWMLQIFGKSFTGGYPVLVVLMGSLIPESIVLICYQHIQSQERMWASLLFIVPRDILLIGLAWLLVPQWGGMGLATAYLIAHSAALLICLLQFRSKGLNLALGNHRRDNTARVAD